MAGTVVGKFTIRTTGGGEQVISISELLQQIGKTLGSDKLDEVLAALELQKTQGPLPGDLITAASFGVLGADLAQLNRRLAKLELSGGVGAVTPTDGFMTLRYDRSPDGVDIVPNDPAAFPQRFVISNKTNKTFAFALTASISGASNNWAQAALFDNNQTTATIVVASGADAFITVNVKAPYPGSVVGETPTLLLQASGPAGENLVDRAAVPLRVSATRGGAVVRSLSITRAVLPLNFNANPDSVSGQMVANVTGSFKFEFKYTDSTQSPPEPGFLLSMRLERADATAPANATSQWDDFYIDGTAVPAAADQTDAQGVRTLSSQINAMPVNTTTRVIPVKLRAKAAGVAIKFTVTMKSTSLVQSVEAVSKTYLITSIQ